MKINDRCIGCRICLSVCPFQAIEMQGSLAQINEKCTECGACITVCPNQAIVRDQVQKESTTQTSGPICVIAEVCDNSIRKVTNELLGAARKLAKKSHSQVICIIAHNTDQIDLNLDADHIYLLEHKLFTGYAPVAYSKAISDQIKNLMPDIVLFGATHFGRDLAPRIAQVLKTGLTADCTELEISESGTLLQTRPAFGGNLMAVIECAKHRPQMATVRPGVMEVTEPQTKSEIHIILPENLVSKLKIIENIKTITKRVNLKDAEIIVAAGRGIGSKENFMLVEKLAKMLSGQVGASRAVVESGWTSSDHQVGQTGTSVKPKLYIACGISGAIQHRVGMQNSDMIIAINKDPKAMIFKIADIGVVGDCNEIIKELISQLEP